MSIKLVPKWKKAWIAFLAYKDLLFLILYPIILLPIPLCNPGLPYKGAYVLLLMAGLWITEVIPLYVTALLPVLLAPLMGIAKSSIISPKYMTDTTIFFLGGLILACALEHNNLQKRIAISVLRIVGGDFKMILMGIMLPTWFLSMWMSNAATTAMMITIAEAVLISLQKEIGVQKEDIQLQEPHSKNLPAGHNTPLLTTRLASEAVERGPGESELDDENNEVLRKQSRRIERFGIALSLGVCYASTCGGIATVTGTPPNSIFFDIMKSNYGPHTGLSFGTWMAFALPISVILFLMVWLWLILLFLGPRAFCKDQEGKRRKAVVQELVKKQTAELGPLTYAEIVCCILFTIVAVLWVTRDLGVFGWGKFFKFGPKNEIYVTDTQPAILVSILFMVIPAVNLRELWRSRYRNFKDNEVPLKTTKQTVLPWGVMQKRFPWGVIILIGGGFALSSICQLSGLSKSVGEYLAQQMKTLSSPALIYVSGQLSSLFTEITSNAAVVSIMLPILFKLADSLQVNPYILGLPATIGSSFAFSLPAGTPANSIVFGNGRVKVIHMIQTGVFLNFAGNLVTLFAMMTYAKPIFNLGEFPAWAMNETLSTP